MATIEKLGNRKVLASVQLGAGLLGLVVPLKAEENEPGWHKARKNEVIEIMSDALGHFDMVPQKVLEDMRESFYRSIPQLDHKFDFALPFRAASNWRNCFSWDKKGKDWNLVEANLQHLRITGDTVMLIVKQKPGQA